MANGIDWFRWHHGSVNDPKFGLVAKKAGARVGDVIAVWALVLEQASAHSDRGVYGDIDHEATDFLLGAEDGTTARILAAMELRALTSNGRVTKWEERQPKRERVDNTAAERKRAQRDRDSAKGGGTDDATPSHAMSHQVTPREEERREEKNKTTTTSASAPAAGGGGDQPDGSDFDAPPAAPLPTLNPALALTLVLRPLGVSAMSTNPTVIGWADQGVTATQLAEAVAIARESKGNESISPQYLVPIVERLRNPAERRGAPRQGDQSQKFNFAGADRTGDAEAMAASMARNGITPAMLAEQDDIPI